MNKELKEIIENINKVVTQCENFEKKYEVIFIHYEHKLKHTSEKFFQLLEKEA